MTGQAPGLEPFGEARQFIDSVVAGEVDPAQVQALLDKARAAKNSRAPGRRLTMTGDGTVRRHSGLFVPARYSEAVADKKPIMVGLFIGAREIDTDDYDRCQLVGLKVDFKCHLAPWVGISGYKLFVGDREQYFPIWPPKTCQVDDTLTLTMRTK